MKPRVSTIDRAMAEGRRDANEGRPPRVRVRGPRTRVPHLWYLNGYHVERSRMRRQKAAAQMALEL